MKQLLKIQFMQTKSTPRKLKSTSIIITISIIFFSIFVLNPSQQYVLAEEAVQQEASAKARKLQLEGTQLQLKGKLKEAIKKYEESISYQSNPRLEKLVITLEKQISNKEKTTAIVQETAEQNISQEPGAPAITLDVDAEASMLVDQTREGDTINQLPETDQLAESKEAEIATEMVEQNTPQEPGTPAEKLDVERESSIPVGYPRESDSFADLKEDT